MVNILAQSGHGSDIQDAIDQVVSQGIGTVSLPTNSTYNFYEPGETWTTVNQPKGVNVVGNNTTLVMPFDAPPEQPFFHMTGDGSKQYTKIAGVRLEGYRELNPANPTLHWGIRVTGIQDFLIQQVDFQNIAGDGVICWSVDGRISGVISQCNFINTSGTFEPWGSHTCEYGVNVGPNRPAAQYNPNVDEILGKYLDYSVYIEDCIFSHWRHDIAANSGAHYILRHSVIENDRPGMNIDAHGNVGTGTRAIEVYNDIIRDPLSTPTNYIVQFRGGAGVVFNNTARGYTNTLAYITKENTDPMYWPGPIWMWNNDLDVGMWSMRGEGTEGVDYYLYEKPGYTPYIYPHPLTYVEPPPTPTPPLTKISPAIIVSTPLAVAGWCLLT